MTELKIENLCSGYQKKPVIKNLYLNASARETIVIMGPSGSGKTTFLLTILGIIKPFLGKVFLNDKDVTNLPVEKHNIGYLPQDYGLFPHMNVQENVAFGLKIRGIPKDIRDKKALEMIRLVNLPGYENRKVKELSGGQKQRVGLARALAIEPALLLLDEPLSNIDQVTKYEVAEHLKCMFQKLNIPIILVTHNHEDAIFLADKLIIMINGTIEQIGELQEVMEHPKTEFIKKLLRPFYQEPKLV